MMGLKRLTVPHSERVDDTPLEACKHCIRGLGVDYPPCAICEHMNEALNKLTAIEDAEPEPRALTEWISVEDRLPDSGTHVLLSCEVRPSGRKYVCDGYYAKAKSITCGCDAECACEYDDDADEYYLLEGYYEVIKNWDDFSSVVIGDFITHWMPLPEPPKE